MAELTEKGVVPAIIQEIADRFTSAYHNGAYQRTPMTFTVNNVEYMELEPVIRKIAEEVLKEEMTVDRSYKRVLLDFIVDQAMEDLS